MRSAMTAAFALAGILFAQVAAAQVVLYDQNGLRGRSFTVNGPVDNLDRTSFNGRATSAVVDRGLWEVCEDAYYRGRCVTLRPGQYPSLGSLDLYNRIASVRPVSGTPHYAAPQPAPPPSYEYYPHYGEQLFQANVVAVRVVLGPPEQRCWVEQQQVSKQNQPNIAGAVVGGVLGGVLGHQIGSGRGNSVATAVGAVGGAYVGSNVNRGSQTQTQDVQRCEPIAGSEKPQYWDVTYSFRGVEHRAQLAFEPGPTITVNEQGEPRV